MAKKNSTNTSAKLLYRPIGLVNGLVAGAVAGVIFKQVWKLVTPENEEDAPNALNSEFKASEVLIAAAVQGAIFAFVKAAVDRSGARLFERATGDWPGD